MRNLGVNEAADAIRGKFFADRSFRGDPEEAHKLKFATDVAKALGAGDKPEDVMHVMGLLREEGIALHAGHEYPKYVTRKWDNTAHVVNDEHEAEAKINEPEPEPAPPVPRVVDAPVQDLSVDLRNSVPGKHNLQSQQHMPKVPSAVTNREAAQDAYARQSTESRDKNAAAEAYAEQDHDFVETHDDDEVHIETLADTGDPQHGGAPYAKSADVGVMAHDDADGDGSAGQDANPAHDSVLGTETPQRKSGDSSAGKTDTTRRPVGNRRPV